MAAFALIAASSAKANVEKFHLSGDLNTLGSVVSFTGTINLDFTEDFNHYTVESFQISVLGRPIFKQSPSVVLSASTTGTIQAKNSANDTLTLWFTTPQAGAWTGFNTGQVYFADLVFGNLTGSLFGGNGVLARVAGLPIVPAVVDPPPVIVPPIVDPPPIASATVPELSTWAMMLLGLAGLGFAAKRRRALGLLSGRA